MFYQIAHKFLHRHITNYYFWRIHWSTKLNNLKLFSIFSTALLYVICYDYDGWWLWWMMVVQQSKLTQMIAFINVVNWCDLKIKYCSFFVLSTYYYQVSHLAYAQNYYFVVHNIATLFVLHNVVHITKIVTCIVHNVIHNAKLWPFVIHNSLKNVTMSFTVSFIIYSSSMSKTGTKQLC